MSVNDPIADMLTRIRNACMARHSTVAVPASKMKVAIADILKREGFIRDYEVQKGQPSDTIIIALKYTSDRRPVITGLKRVSKPGLRSTRAAPIFRACVASWVGTPSTPKGVMAGHEAWQQHVGGEVLCYVW